MHPFDNPVQFRTHIINPIQRGEIFGIERLKSLVQTISLRRTKQSVFGELRLEPRIERVESVQLNEEERSIYNIVKKSGTYTTNNRGSVGNIFWTITKLRQVCNHGRELLCPATLAVLDHDYKNNGVLIVEELQSCENCGIAVQGSGSDEISDYLLPCWHIVCYKCSSQRSADKVNEKLCPVCSYSGTSDLFLEDEQAVNSFLDLPHGDMDVDSAYRPSSKVRALLQNLSVDRLGSTKDPIKRQFPIILLSYHQLISNSVSSSHRGRECSTWSKRHLWLRESSLRELMVGSLFVIEDRQFNLFVTIHCARY